LYFQISEIKKNYFINIFNENFITESFEFIEENKLLDIEKSYHLKLPLDFYFQDKFIFEEICNIYNLNYKCLQQDKKRSVVVSLDKKEFKNEERKENDDINQNLNSMTIKDNDSDKDEIRFLLRSEKIIFKFIYLV